MKIGMPACGTMIIIAVNAIWPKPDIISVFEAELRRVLQGNPPYEETVHSVSF